MLGGAHHKNLAACLPPRISAVRSRPIAATEYTIALHHQRELIRAVA